MKHTKKLASLLLALALAFALAVPAFAATVTVPSEGILQGHAFTAYQIFSGREENNVLSDVQWGSGIDSTAFLAALKADTTYGSKFTNCTDAAAVAKALSGTTSDSELANKVAELAYKHKTGSGTALTSGENTLADGYYLVVDTTKNVAEGSAYNKALLQVVGNINITAKTDAPTVEKKVKEGTAYGDVADCNIGDSVEFLLIGSVPDMSRYDTYKYIFHDTLSAGLTAPVQGNVKVYLSADKNLDTTTTTDTDVTNSFTVAVDGQTITVSCDNIKSIDGIAKDQYIIVAYSAILNKSAVIGLDGNLNTVKLEYSNKPDQSGAGDTGNTGKTPEDKVIVFTYELDVTKVDGQDRTKLSGAEFKLHNSENKWAIIDTNDKLTGWTDTESEGSTLTSDANGLFKVVGLDAGTYYLKEIKAPSGYNKLENEINVVITATISTPWDGQKANTALTALQIKVDNGTPIDGNVNSGVVATDVLNNKGATLPETGGMGTTVFYVLGGVLVVGAVVLLITKKRMGAEH